MADLATTVSDLEKNLSVLCAKEERLRAEEDRIVKERREIEESIEAVNLVLRVYPEWRASNPAIETDADALAITAQDIAHCRTQREALVEIAKRNGGIVKAKIAAKLMREAHLAKGQKTSAIASVHRTMSNSPDWEWVEPGSFRYKGFYRDFALGGKDASPEE